MKSDVAHAVRQFMERFEAVTESGCWIWTGAVRLASPGNAERPRILVCGKHVYAHRFAYEQFVEPIPGGMFVCHHCDVPLCVNPTHLFLGTARDNMRDMIRKGRAKFHGLMYTRYWEIGHQ